MGAINGILMGVYAVVISETTGPIKLKFHMETPLNGGMKVCSNGSGHMTKMAATPIYGKILKGFFTIYGHGGHLGHVTKIFCINFG